MRKITNIDKFGRLLIPKAFRKSLKLRERSLVMLEEKGNQLIVTPTHEEAPDVVRKIASMNLPVKSWQKVEKEIEKAYHG